MSNEVSRGMINPPEWRALAAKIRALPGRAVWEIFAGSANLSVAFEAEGWHVAPAVDVMIEPAFDLLNPLFMAVVLGLVLEGWFVLVHLGPPCSSFSMAVNRFPSYRLRDVDHPCGVPDLPHHRQVKVEMGNALADATIRIVQAQMATKSFWQVEQPESSLMWYLPAFLELRRKFFHATRDVCMDGAPWCKPTTIIANFEGIQALECRCKGGHDHLPLVGRAPDGRSWMAIACPYWPGFTQALAKVWKRCKPSSTEQVDHQQAHRGGVIGVCAEGTWAEVLE